MVPTVSMVSIVLSLCAGAGVLQCLMVSVVDLLVCTVSGVSVVPILSMVSYIPPT